MGIRLKSIVLLVALECLKISFFLTLLLLPCWKKDKKLKKKCASLQSKTCFLIPDLESYFPTTDWRDSWNEWHCRRPTLWAEEWPAQDRCVESPAHWLLQETWRPGRKGRKTRRMNTRRTTINNLSHRIFIFYLFCVQSIGFSRTIAAGPTSALLSGRPTGRHEDQAIRTGQRTEGTNLNKAGVHYLQRQKSFGNDIRQIQKLNTRKCQV